LSVMGGNVKLRLIIILLCILPLPLCGGEFAPVNWNIFRCTLYTGLVPGYGSYEANLENTIDAQKGDVGYLTSTEDMQYYRTEDVPGPRRYGMLKAVAGGMVGLGINGRLSGWSYPFNTSYYVFGAGIEVSGSYRRTRTTDIFCADYSLLLRAYLPFWLKISFGKLYADKPIAYITEMKLDAKNRRVAAERKHAKVMDMRGSGAVIFFPLPPEDLSTYIEWEFDEFYVGEKLRVSGSSFNVGIVKKFFDY